MKFARLISLAALSAATLVLVGSESRAATITLPNELGVLTAALPATIVEGTGSPTATFLFTAVTASNLTLSSIAIGALSPAGATGAAAVPPFGFVLTGNIASSSTTQTSELDLVYTVTSSGPLITSATLFGDAAVTGTGFARIVEDIFTVGPGNTQGVFLGELISTPLNPTATLTFAIPSPSFYMVKQIIVGRGPNGAAIYRQVRDTVNDFPGVPEPASMVSLGTGLVGVLGLSLRRKTNKV